MSLDADEILAIIRILYHDNPIIRQKALITKDNNQTIIGVNMKLKCHGCGSEKETDLRPKEFVCKICGAVNIVQYNDGSSEDAAGCIPPTSFEWSLPAGILESPAGKIYVTAQGSHMSKAEYIDAFGIDPDIAKEWMKKMAAEGKPGFYKIGGKK